MRIAFVSFETVYHRDTETNQRFRTVCELFAARGHDVHCYCAGFWAGEESTFERNGVTYHAVSSGHRGSKLVPPAAAVRPRGRESGRDPRQRTAVKSGARGQLGIDTRSRAAGSRVVRRRRRERHAMDPSGDGPAGPDRHALRTRRDVGPRDRSRRRYRRDRPETRSTASGFNAWNRAKPST